MRSFRAAVFFLACAAMAWAQSDRGTITGTITDPSGAVLAGASVEARAATFTLRGYCQRPR